MDSKQARQDMPKKGGNEVPNIKERKYGNFKQCEQKKGM